MPSWPGLRPFVVLIATGIRPARTLPAADLWQALADTKGEIRRVPCGLCFFRDVAAGSEIGERQVRVDLTALVEQFVGVAVNEQSPVQATASANVLCMAAYRRRAVLRQRVVPPGMVGKSIHLIEIVNQKRSRLRDWNANAV
jgi:hypothetical protein